MNTQTFYQIWLLRHAVGAKYPNKPTEEDARNMSGFVTILGKTIPCKHCRGAFTEILTQEEEGPLINTTNEKTVSESLYNTHDRVTSNLGAIKTVPPFPEWHREFKGRLARDGDLSPELLLQFLWDELFSVAYTYPIAKDETDDKRIRREAITELLGYVPWAVQHIAGKRAVSSRKWKQAMNEFDAETVLESRDTLNKWLIALLDQSTDVTPPWWATGSFVGPDRGPMAQFGSEATTLGYLRRYMPAIAIAQVRVGVGKKALGCR